mmetsp:Transcript_63203/g.135741  ORF Transcript_63203/g.135741 Transcript_63203/m.135741 type:complete len:327 (+) Transcript_63203:1104-2084(+)
MPRCHRSSNRCCQEQATAHSITPLGPQQRHRTPAKIIRPHGNSASGLRLQLLFRLRRLLPNRLFPLLRLLIHGTRIILGHRLPHILLVVYLAVSAPMNHFLNYYSLLQIRSAYLAQLLPCTITPLQTLLREMVQELEDILLIVRSCSSGLVAPSRNGVGSHTTRPDIPHTLSKLAHLLPPQGKAPLQVERDELHGNTHEADAFDVPAHSTWLVLRLPIQRFQITKSAQHGDGYGGGRDHHELRDEALEHEEGGLVPFAGKELVVIDDVCKDGVAQKPAAKWYSADGKNQQRKHHLTLADKELHHVGGHAENRHQEPGFDLSELRGQ